jgi:hypothetical protein
MRCLVGTPELAQESSINSRGSYVHFTTEITVLSFLPDSTFLSPIMTSQT